MGRQAGDVVPLLSLTAITPSWGGEGSDDKAMLVGKAGLS